MPNVFAHVTHWDVEYGNYCAVGNLETADTVSALYIQLSQHTICVAVAGRDPQKLQRWMDETRSWLISKQHSKGAVRACTYDELIDDENIEIVYIPLPTTWVTKAAHTKKHILQ